MVASESKVWKCAECNYFAARKGDIIRHYKSIHQSEEEQEKMKWKCLHDGCSLSTLQKSNLDGHIIMKHTNAKPYKCTCGVEFNHPRAVSEHVRDKSKGATGHVAIKFDKATFMNEHAEAFAKVCPPPHKVDQDQKDSWMVWVGAGSAEFRSANSRGSSSSNLANFEEEDESATATFPATAAQEGNKDGTKISSSPEETTANMSTSRLVEASFSKTTTSSSSQETLEDILESLRLSTNFPPPPSPPKRSILEPSASANSVRDTPARPYKRKDREDTENDNPSGSEPRKVARCVEDSPETHKSDASPPKPTIPAPRLIRRGPPPLPVHATALHATPSLNVPATCNSDASGKTASNSDYHYNASFPTHCESCKKLSEDVKVVMAVVHKVYGNIAMGVM